MFYLFIAVLMPSLSVVLGGQCDPFEADVYLPLDTLSGTTVPGQPLDGVADAAVVLNDNTHIGMGKAAYMSGSKIHITDDPSHGCFFAPMVECTDGFTLSVLITTDPGQAGSNQVYISSGGDTQNSVGFSLVFSDNAITATLKRMDGFTTLYTAEAVDNTYVYDNTQASNNHIAVVWNSSSVMLELYRDGQFTAQGARQDTSTFVSDETQNFFLGQSSLGGSVYGRGHIDELIYFYTPLDADFIEGLFENYNFTSLCKSSCVSVADGRYQSCVGCNMYVECVSEVLEQHVCPEGYSWSTGNGTCVFGAGSCDTRIIANSQNSTCFSPECANDPCQNGATCTDSTDGFTCHCLPGYEGGYCEIDINECESSPCIEGQCIDQVNMYECNCTAGFYQVHCDELDGCYGDPCLNGALNCTDFINGTDDDSFVCECAPGYTGLMCETEVDECDSSPCMNNATCNDQVNSYECVCQASYVGVHCEGYDECDVNPCMNGGNCTENSTLVLLDYQCQCQDGFSGVNCEVENECITQNVVCQNGGTCEDLEGDWNCTCAPGYVGDVCETEVDECSSSPCMNGQCNNLINMYNCICDDGYQGTNCDDYDYCFDEPCENGSCEDFDDTTSLTYDCTCDVGFSGVNCSIENECITQSVVCLNEGVCEDMEGNYTCTNCTDGYGGQHCEVDLDECSSDPCQNGATCTDMLNMYTCACTPEYLGTHCEEFDNCFEEPCDNDGACMDLTDGYNCTCMSGFSGENCTLEDECITNDVTCQNGGTCTDDPSEPWECACAAGYWGTLCQHDDMCETSSTCENGATCDPAVGSFSCLCADGYSNENCSFAEECILQNISCLNGATCNNLPGNWTCECPETHMGTFCEEDNPCYENDCDVIGTEMCQALNETHYECLCNSGFEGDMCDTGPCNHTATPVCNMNNTRQCIHYSDGSHDCECLSTYSGDSCDTLRALTEVTGFFRVTSVVYSSDFEDPTTTAYMELKDEAEEGMSAICECQATVTGFREGSVIVDFLLYMAVNPNLTQVREMMQEGHTAGTLLPGEDIDMESFSFTEVSLGQPVIAGASTGDDGDDTEDNEYLVPFIVILVFFLILLAVIVLVAFFGMKRFHNSNGHRVSPESPLINDNESTLSSDVSHTTSEDVIHNKEDDMKHNGENGVTNNENHGVNTENRGVNTGSYVVNTRNYGVTNNDNHGVINSGNHGVINNGNHGITNNRNHGAINNRNYGSNNNENNEVMNGSVDNTRHNGDDNSLNSLPGEALHNGGDGYLHSGDNDDLHNKDNDAISFGDGETIEPTTTRGISTHLHSEKSSRSSTWVAHSPKEEDEDLWKDKEVKLTPSDEVAAGTFDSHLLYRGQMLPPIRSRPPPAEQSGDKQSLVLTGPAIDADDYNSNV